MSGSEGATTRTCPQCGMVLSESSGSHMCPSCKCLISDGDFRLEVRGTSAEDVAVVGRAMMRTRGRGSRLNISNSTIGMLTTGDLTNLGRIEVSTRTLAESGQQDLADALARLTEAVTASQETLRSEHLQTLDELAKQAALPEKKRTASGVLKTLVKGLQTGLEQSAELARAWTTWGPVVLRAFGIS